MYWVVGWLFDMLSQANGFVLTLGFFFALSVLEVNMDVEISNNDKIVIISTYDR